MVTGAELEKLAEPIKVYNLEVADFNTYFVGDEAVLVHNYDQKKNYPDQDIYVLYDDNGNIQYVGRSVDANTRIDQHGRSEARGHLHGYVVAEGLPYEAGRGMEQIGIDRFGTLDPSTGYNNKINGVNPNSEYYSTFMDAGNDYADIFDKLLDTIKGLIS